VITGIGPVTTIGTGKEVFMKRLYDLNHNIQPIPETFTQSYQFKSNYYSPLSDMVLSDYSMNLHIEKIMHQKDILATIASKLALEDAGFRVESKPGHLSVAGLSTCVTILGTGISTFGPACDGFVAHLQNGKICEYKEHGRRLRFNRMAIPMTMSNSPAAWISIIFKLKGPSYTLNASCASGSYAIGEAVRQIKNGQSDMAIAGGIEYLKDMYGYAMRGFDCLGTLTKSEDGLPRPFSKKRNGFLFSEGGACMLILEEYGHARKRNADIYAEINGFQTNSDAYSIVQIDPSGKQIKKLIQKTIRNKKIDYINAHGTATETNDKLEAEVIRKIFGDKKNQPYINSTKSILGHSIGAAGAIEAAVTAMTVKYGKIHGNLTSEVIDNLNLPLETIEKEITRAMSLSFGFGGHNSCLIMKKV
jgi:3-oxoacyl-[acyl-carrier-protein] synthase II